MTRIRVQEAAAARIDEIYRYARKRWGEAQADENVTGLFDAFEGIAADKAQLSDEELKAMLCTANQHREAYSQWRGDVIWNGQSC